MISNMALILVRPDDGAGKLIGAGGCIKMFRLLARLLAIGVLLLPAINAQPAAEPDDRSNGEVYCEGGRFTSSAECEAENCCQWEGACHSDVGNGACPSEGAPPPPGGGGDGGGPPDCIAASFEACGEDDDCIGATEAALCAGEIDRSSCSEDDNADIDSHCSTGIEPIIGARSHSVFVTATAVDQITDLKQHDLNDCKVVYTTAPTTSDSTDSADATSVSVDAAITAEAMATAHQRCVASAGRLTLSSDAFAAPVSEAVSEGGSTEEQHEQHDATFTTSMVYYGQLGAAGTDECVAIASLGQIGIVPHESSSRELSELPCYERSASASCSEFNTYDRASGAMQACEDRGAKMCNGRSVPTTMADPRAIQMALQEPAKLAEFTPLCHRDLPRGFKAPGLGTFTGDDSTRETVGGETKGTTDTVWCRGATRSGFDEELSRLSVTMSVKAAEDLFAGLDENSDQSLSAAEFAVFSDTWTRSNAAGNPPLSPALANFGVANGEANFGVAGVCSV